jgi:hypothetical protein
MKPSDVKKQVAKQNKAVYGDTAQGGHMAGLNTDDDTEQNVKEVFGNAPVSGEPFFMDDEIDEDEKNQMFTTDAKAKQLLKEDKKKGR